MLVKQLDLNNINALHLGAIMTTIGTNSKINFIFPFSFLSNDCDLLVKKIESEKWEGRNSDYPVWQPYEITKLPDIALLPSVSNFLDPNSESPLFNAGAWILSNQALTSMKSGLGGRKIKWIYQSGNKEYEFFFLDIHLFLFKTGVGFLGFQISLPENSHSDLWLDFLHFFRFSGGPRAQGCFIHARRIDDSQPFVPAFLKGKANLEVGSFELKDLISSLLDINSCETSKKNNWWQEIYIKDYLIPYFYINATIDEEVKRNAFLYRLDSFLTSKSLAQMDENSYQYINNRSLYIWKDHCFIFNIEGGGLVSINTPDNVFFKNVLPDHIMKHYYVLYLIALQQKFFITSLSAKIANSWLIARSIQSDNQKYLRFLHDTFTELQDLLLLFSTIGYFSQIMYSQHHHDVYVKWVEILGIDQMYQGVKNEVEYIFNYISAENEKNQQKFNKRLETLVQGVSTIIGFPVFAISIMDIISNQKISVIEIWRTILLGTLIGTVVFVAIQIFSRPKK